MKRSSYEGLVKYAANKNLLDGVSKGFKKSLRTGAAIGAMSTATNALNHYKDNVNRIKSETPGAMISEYQAPALGNVDYKGALKKGIGMGAAGAAIKGASLAYKGGVKPAISKGVQGVKGLFKSAEEEDNYLEDLDCEVCGYSGKPHHTGACPNCGSPSGKKRSHVRHDDYARSKDEPWSQNHEHFDAYNDDSWIW